MTSNALPYAALPRLHEPAPAFRAHSTQGPRCLEDYAGRWLLLFSHPADFTPVCTTEILALARRFAEFQQLGCDLLGLSVDSVYSHIAWLRDIEARFGVAVPFPVLEDSSRRIASAYGMIHPFASDTSTVRGTFFIDPDGMLRAMQYYPMTTGRSVDEMLRLVAALQTTSESRVATPADWRPGGDVVLGAPDTIPAVTAGDGAWYLRLCPAKFQQGPKVQEG